MAKYYAIEAEGDCDNKSHLDEWANKGQKLKGYYDRKLKICMLFCFVF